MGLQVREEKKDNKLSIQQIILAPLSVTRTQKLQIKKTEGHMDTLRRNIEESTLKSIPRYLRSEIVFELKRRRYLDKGELLVDMIQSYLGITLEM
jgi:hypothetical protein